MKNYLKFSIVLSTLDCTSPAFSATTMSEDPLTALTLGNGWCISYEDDAKTKPLRIPSEHQSTSLSNIAASHVITPLSSNKSSFDASSDSSSGNIEMLEATIAQLRLDRLKKQLAKASIQESDHPNNKTLQSTISSDQIVNPDEKTRPPSNFSSNFSKD